jgi:competence protein ComEC
MMVRIHFLNVGHGDCTVIEHASGRLTMIDINNGADLDAKSVNELAAAYGLSEQTRSIRKILGGASDSTLLAEKGYGIELTNPIAFMAGNYATQPIFRYVQTHPHLDHMRGLVALRGAAIEVINFWDTYWDQPPDFQSDSDENEWREYRALAEGQGGATVLRLTRGAANIYYNRDPQNVPGGDGIEILAPTPELIQLARQRANPHLIGYVLRLNCHGISVILGGDADKEVWDSIVDYYGAGLKCHVLKASHHGRDTGYHQRAIALMKPEYTIVSVGRKPDTDASNKYRQYSDNVWSTRWRGNITLTIDHQGRGQILPQYDRVAA